MLTERQTQALQFIQSYITQHGITPSISQIQAHLGVNSRSMVQRILETLEKRAFIRRTNAARNNIKLLEHSDPFTLPLVGRIAAGSPIEAIENVEPISLADLIVQPGRFLLQVKGDSMVGDNICNGDWIICEKAETARSGQIVIALIDREEATLKRIFFKDDQILLEPSNKHHNTQVFHSDQVHIRGIYVGLIRIGK